MKVLPKWLLIAIALYIAVLTSYAVYDNRSVEFFPPKIAAKDSPTLSPAGPLTALPKGGDLVFRQEYLFSKSLIERSEKKLRAFSSALATNMRGRWKDLK